MLKIDMNTSGMLSTMGGGTTDAADFVPYIQKVKKLNALIGN